jgi:galactose mutarotase-like enzyme
LITSISEGRLSAQIDSNGAQLMSLKLDDYEYLWQGDERWWPRRAPILFPCVGVLMNGVAQSPKGEVRLGRHGLARNYEHAIVETTEKSVTFELSSTDEMLEHYPYPFKLNMAYSVDGARLTQTYAVTNTGESPMPFTLGGHPAFNVPAPASAGEKFEDYELEFSEPWTCDMPTIDADGICDLEDTYPVIVDSDKLPLTHELFEKLLTITLPKVPGRTVKLVGTKSGRGVRLDFDGFDYLGVWSADNRAPFVAVEPWTGIAACKGESGRFEEKPGTIMLAPGETCTKSFSILPF